MVMKEGRFPIPIGEVDVGGGRGVMIEDGNGSEDGHGFGRLVDGEEQGSLGDGADLLVMIIGRGLDGSVEFVAGAFARGGVEGFLGVE